MSEAGFCVLIVEDGDEYMDTLGRYVQGPRYLQAHDAREAISLLRRERVDVIYLDMRFDRIDSQRLVGDWDSVLRKHNGNVAKALQHLQNHQGLYVLQAIEAAGFHAVPTVVSYDFSREARRWSALARAHPQLRWVSDTVGSDEIKRLLTDLARAS